MPNVKSFNDLGHFGNLLAEVRIIIVKWIFREEDILNYKNIYPFINLYDQSFASVVQYDKVENGRRKIASCCENMTATYLGSPLQRLAHFVSRKDKCLKNNYEKFVTLYRNETWDAQSDISKHITIKIACVNYLLFIILFFFLHAITVRQWYYQTCTEYGYYQTSNSTKSIFGSLFPLLYFTNICEDLYGE